MTTVPGTTEPEPGLYREGEPIHDNIFHTRLKAKWDLPEQTLNVYNTGSKGSVCLVRSYNPIDKSSRLAAG